LPSGLFAIAPRPVKARPVFWGGATLPVPKPHKGEQQQDFVARCARQMFADGTTKDPKQAAAICFQAWRDRNKAGMDATDDLERAWAPIEVKRQTDKAKPRTIAGTASTPATDRMGDIVEPLGLAFDNPLPLLWQHKHDQPIGLAFMDKPSSKGITFTAQLADVPQPGKLRDRIDEATQSIDAGLVRGVSIGFKSLEKSFLDDGGVRFIRSELVELSLVTVPANAEATISTIKSLDAASLAAPGRNDARETPGAAGKAHKPEQKAKAMKQTIAEQISAFDARRTAARTRMQEMMTTRADAGETLDDAESTEYDGLEAEIKKIDSHIERLVRLEEQNKALAKPATGTTPAVASDSRDPTDGVKHSGGVIRVKQNVPEWVAPIRTYMTAVLNRFDPHACAQYVKRRTDWHSSTPELQNIWSDEFCYLLRAAVPAGTTYDSTWAGALVYAQNLGEAFAQFLRPLTIIGRIPGLRRVPFNVRIPRATGGTTAGWVGEAAPKPLTSMTFDAITLTWAKAAAISVITEELARFSNPAAETVVRDDLARGITQFLDRQFVDPSVGAVTGVSPASITNGITPITPTGVNMAAFRADVKTLMNQLLIANQSITTGVWIMTQQQAMALSIAQNSLGQVIYPTISPDQGGTLLGYPVVASENIPATGGSPADGYPLIFAVANEILLADDGQTVIDASREASLNMDSTPDSPPTASTNMLSLWQLNQIGLKAERWITWARRRTTAVAWIQNAKYAE
jgi:HK97 family phage prohead protease